MAKQLMRKNSEPIARKSRKERRIRHKSRVEKRQAYPRVSNGRLLLKEDNDEQRAWMDWHVDDANLVSAFSRSKTQ
jgi:hypothetical protein